MELRSVTEAQAIAKGANGDPSSLSSADFLKMMTTQLQNQDPFNPQDQTQMLAQMAQFSTVAGISEMNVSIAKLADSLRSTQMLNAASLIGKDALVANNTASLSEPGGEVRGQIELPQSTSAVAVEVRRANGELVRNINLGPQGGGAVDFIWDGKADDGSDMPAGDYLIRANFNTDEGVAGAATYLKAKINSVSIPAGGGSAQLNVEGVGQLTLADVKAVG